MFLNTEHKKVLVVFFMPSQGYLYSKKVWYVLIIPSQGCIYMMLSVSEYFIYTYIHTYRLQMPLFSLRSVPFRSYTYQ